jgi:hypothetical protein
MLQTLSQKVLVTAGLFLAVIAVVAILAVASTLELRATTAYLAGDIITRINLLKDIETDLTRCLGETESFLRGRGDGDLVEAQAALDDTKGQLATLNTLVGENNDAYDAQFAPDLVRIRDQL